MIDAVYHDAIQVQQLAYLVALARERHFARAAASCHVTQPTLSAGIRRLEQEFGATLVLRGRRYEGLTAEGERMRSWAQRIVADVDAMRRDLAAEPAALTGRLRIGAIPTSLPVLSRYTRLLQASHPGVELAITSLSSREIEDGLRGARVDVGITYLDNEPLRAVRSRALYSERYVFLTGAGRRDQRVTWAAIAHEPLCLLSPDMQHRRIVDDAFAAAGVTPTAYLETNSITALYGHVRDGLASGVVADAWIELFGVPEGLVALSLTAPDMHHVIGAVWLDRDPEPLLTQAFVAGLSPAATRGPAL